MNLRARCKSINAENQNGNVATDRQPVPASHELTSPHNIWL